MVSVVSMYVNGQQSLLRSDVSGATRVHGVLLSESLKLSMHFPLHCMEWDIINVKEEWA